jgi:hypothetical protein
MEVAMMTLTLVSMPLTVLVAYYFYRKSEKQTRIRDRAMQAAGTASFRFDKRGNPIGAAWKQGVSETVTGFDTVHRRVNYVRNISAN